MEISYLFTFQQVTCEDDDKLKHMVSTAVNKLHQTLVQAAAST